LGHLLTAGELEGIAVGANGKKARSLITDVAKLHGYRLTVAQETQKDRKWDEAKIKSLTGGDKMTARFIARETYRRWIMAKGAQGCTDALGFSLSLEPRIPNLQSEMRQPSFKHRRLESFGRCVVLRRRSGRLTGALICRLSTNSGKC
jgi:putative DNA primase/helicase